MPDPPAERVAAADAVVVAGGNTANMLAVWRLHGIDTALRSRWDDGAVLGGVSAGANCWFEACVTDSFSVELDGLADGLGLLEGSFCPHFDGEERRRPVYARLLAEGFAPESRVTTVPRRCIAAGSSSRSSPTVPAPLAIARRRAGFEPIETRLLG